jgi:hypothetical protein
MERISKHISYHEATVSNTALRLGIKNIPNEDQLTAMKLVAENCFEPARKWWGHPIRVNSFFRCLELNTAVKGSKTSQHIKGEAIDMTTKSKEGNKKLFEWCKANLIFDQLIDEYDYSWIHISFSKAGNRNQSFSVK